MRNCFYFFHFGLQEMGGKKGQVNIFNVIYDRVKHYFDGLDEARKSFEEPYSIKWIELM